ncbi:MAG: hypothetical protein K0R14_1694 [Burkholderiales bacterium]|jgi:hypothetical protein|nr:hypothetical protein [Burkholderiales bacterium]
MRNLYKFLFLAILISSISLANALQVQCATITKYLQDKIKTNNVYVIYLDIWWYRHKDTGTIITIFGNSDNIHPNSFSGKTWETINDDIGANNYTESKKWSFNRVKDTQMWQISALPWFNNDIAVFKEEDQGVKWFEDSDKKLKQYLTLLRRNYYNVITDREANRNGVMHFAL